MRQKLLIIIALLLISYSGYELFYPKEEGRNQKVSLTIASIIETNNMVRHKRSDNLSWKESSEGIELAQNDMIYTGEKSSATLLSKDNMEIFIAPNTLLALRAGEKGVDLNLKKGVVDIVLKKQTKIVVQGKRIQSSKVNSVLRIEKNKVKVIKGSLKVDGKKIEVKNHITLMTPISSKKIKITEDKEINFKWESKHKIEKYKLTIRRLDQKKAVVIKETDKTEFNQFLDTGYYLWFVSGDFKGKKIISEKNYLIVNVAYSNMRLMNFKPNSRAFIRFPYDRILDINFSWNHFYINNGKRSKVDLKDYQYNFKLYKRDKMKAHLIGEQMVDRPNIKYQIKTPGEYVWLVIPIGPAVEKYKPRKVFLSIDRDRAPAPIIEDNLKIDLIDSVIEKNE